MKPNVLDMLIDFFADFDQSEPLPFDAYTLEKLEKMGFNQEMIEDAYAWFHEAQDDEYMEHVNDPSARAIRVYTPQESAVLSSACKSLLFKLEQAGVLTMATREIIISQMLQLDIAQMDIEQLKWLSIIALSDHLDDATITRLLDYLLLQEDANAKLEIN
jgi:Smg protein